MGESDLPVFGTEQDGGRAVVLNKNPVGWVLRPESLLRITDGYSLIVRDNAMSPEHKSGSTALVHPHTPPRSQTGDQDGDTCVFRERFEAGGAGGGKVCIGELMSEAQDAWHIRQRKPKKDLMLKKAEWPFCHVTVGNYFRR